MATFQRYLVLTPFAKADILEKILRLRKLDASVEATQSGAIVYHDLPVKEYDDWDIAELLGSPADFHSATVETGSSIESADVVSASALSGDGAGKTAYRETNSAPETDLAEEFSVETGQDPIYVAKVLSRLSPYGVILFTVELGDEIGGESGVSGLVHAQRVVNGEVTEELAPGMVLSVLDQRIEDLLIAAPPSQDSNFVTQ